ncbi:MAG: NTP transferase domain-containing protein [Chitinispirillaceae bacterium]|nr:NTP transferase domain-containing protein [Chitinispirillaceae bacterium]
MRGFILAAGFGTRLRPITDHLPKALVPLAGKPLLAHAVDYLHLHDIKTIAANTHYRAEAIEEFRTSTGNQFMVFHEEPEIRGTGGALDFARPFLGADDTFFIINVDIIARFDLATHIRGFLASDDCCRLLAFENTGGTGTVRYDPETFAYRGTLADTATEDGAFTADFIGMTLYRREFLPLVGPDDFSILPVWKRAGEMGMRVSVDIIREGYWRDIGTPKSLAQTHFDIIDGILDLEPPPSCTIDRERKVCYPRDWKTVPAGIGRYSWIEALPCALAVPIERTVIFRNAAADTLAGTAPLQSTLCTPWGAMKFDG